MLRNISVALALYFTATLSARAATTEECTREVLQDFSTRLENYAMRGHPNNRDRSFFRANRILNGSSGGHRIELIASNDGWESVIWGDIYNFPIDRWGADAGDLIPDLRTIPLLLGRNRSPYFGFEWNPSAPAATVPDIAELSGAIGSFNEGLAANDPRRILISVYPTQAVFVDPITYRREFARHRRVPVHYGRRQFFHDIAGHGLEGIYLPNEYVEAVHSRAVFWDAFIEHLRARGLTLLPEARRLDLAGSEPLAEAIDNFGNFIGIFISDRVRNGLNPGIGPTNELLLRRSRILYETPEVFFESLIAQGRFSARLVREFQTFSQNYSREHPNAHRIITRENLEREINEVRGIYDETPFPTPEQLERGAFSSAFAQRLRRIEELQKARRGE